MIQIRASGNAGPSRTSGRPFRRLLTAACASALLSAGLFTVASGQTAHSVTPREGFVPDRATATRIAEAVLIPVYGVELVQRQKPLRPELDNGIWTVWGTNRRGNLGGVAVVQISKADGRILRVSHGR
jgi:hypothetical protein